MQFEPTWKFDCVAAHGGALTAGDIDRPRNVSQPLPPSPSPSRITTPPWSGIADIATLATLNPSFFPSSSSGIENSRGDAADNFLPRDQIEGELVTFLQRIFEATSGPVGEKVWRRLAKMYRWNNFVRGERVMENFNFSGSSIFVKIYRGIRLWFPQRSFPFKF